MTVTKITIHKQDLQPEVLDTNITVKELCVLTSSPDVIKTVIEWVKCKLKIIKDAEWTLKGR